MSATTRSDVRTAIDGCQSVDVTPIVLEAESLESTAPAYLRDLKRTLSEEGLQPARLTTRACFDSASSITVQEEVDRLRGYVRAASFLGAGTITVEFDSVADTNAVRSALAACAERAEREGLQFDCDGPIDLTE